MLIDEYLSEPNARNSNELMVRRQLGGITPQRIIEQPFRIGEALSIAIHSRKIRQRDPDGVMLVVVHFPVNVDKPDKIPLGLVQIAFLLRYAPQFIQR